MYVSLRRNLREVGDAEDLMLRGDALQATTERLTRSSTETSVNLIKDQCPPLTRITKRLFKGERDTTQLATRSDLRDGGGGLTSIRREEILNLIPAAAINQARHTINEWIVAPATTGLQVNLKRGWQGERAERRIHRLLQAGRPCSSRSTQLQRQCANLRRKFGTFLGDRPLTRCRPLKSLHFRGCALQRFSKTGLIGAEPSLKREDQAESLLNFCNWTRRRLGGATSSNVACKVINLNR
jgi:hypothetical protein